MPGVTGAGKKKHINRGPLKKATQIHRLYYYPLLAAGIFVPPVARWFCSAADGPAWPGGTRRNISINPLLVNPESKG